LIHLPRVVVGPIMCCVFFSSSMGLVIVTADRWRRSYKLRNLLLSTSCASSAVVAARGICLIFSDVFSSIRRYALRSFSACTSDGEYVLEISSPNNTLASLVSALPRDGGEGQFTQRIASSSLRPITLANLQIVLAFIELGLRQNAASHGMPQCDSLSQCIAV
jgi:hypothetical protein